MESPGYKGVNSSAISAIANSIALIALWGFLGDLDTFLGFDSCFSGTDFVVTSSVGVSTSAFHPEF